MSVLARRKGIYAGSSGLCVAGSQQKTMHNPDQVGGVLAVPLGALAPIQGGKRGVAVMPDAIRSHGNVFEEYIDLVLDLVHYLYMTTVTIHEAKTHLSRLIERALAGEEVVVTRGRDPVVALKPLHAPKIKRRLDGLPGLIKNMAADFDAPMSDFEEYSA